MTKTSIKGTVIGIDNKPIDVDSDGIADVAGLHLRLFLAKTGEVWGYPPGEEPQLFNLCYVGTLAQRKTSAAE